MARGKQRTHGQRQRRWGGSQIVVVVVASFAANWNAQGTSKKSEALTGDHRSASHSTYVLRLPTASISLYLYCTLQPLLTTTLCTCNSYWIGVCRVKRNPPSPGHRSPLSRLPRIFRRPIAWCSIRLKYYKSSDQEIAASIGQERSGMFEVKLESLVSSPGILSRLITIFECGFWGGVTKVTSRCREVTSLPE